METTMFHVKADELKGLIDRYEKFVIEGYIFNGLILSPSQDDEGKPCIYSYPLYASADQATTAGNIIVENKTTAKACPYPPGY